MDWMKNMIDSLERILDKPPYLIFFFAAVIFVAISEVTTFKFNEVWAFLIYSVVGSIWRYAERDIVRSLERDYREEKDRAKLESKEVKGDRSKLVWLVIITYHVGNLTFLVYLLRYLKLL